MANTVPILRVFDAYLISLVGELSDEEVQELQEAALNALQARPARGFVIDVTGLDLVDSYLARVFDDLGLAAAAMGARTVLVGLKPAVAMTLVEMGIEMRHLDVALNVDAGLRRLGCGDPETEARQRRALAPALDRIRSRRDQILRNIRDAQGGLS